MSNEERLEQLINELQLIMKDLGVATAYGYAVEKGYTGTEEEFAELMASYATVAQDAAHSAEQAAESATNAHNSEINAGTSEGHAEQSKLDAQAAKNAAETAQGKAEEAQGKAETAETNADGYAEDAEAWAVGTRDGSPVGQTDPTYHNNAKYYAEEAERQEGRAAQDASDASDAKDAAVSAKNDAVDAKDLAVSAKNDAVDAKDSAVSAKNDAELAETGAVNAKNDAIDAKDAAVSAKTDAQTAKNDAVSAKNDAVTAKTDAQTAKDQAVSAKNDAQTAKSGADSAKADAISAKNDAVTAKNGAVDAKVAAQAAQAAAEAAAAQASDKANMEAVAEIWDNTKAYKIGILLSYNGKMYYCIADAPAGTLPTNTAYFEEKSVADIIEMIKQGAIQVGKSNLANNFDSKMVLTDNSGYLYRTTGGSLEVGEQNRVKKIVGASVPIIQLLDVSQASTETINDVVFTNNNDGTWKVNGTATGGSAGKLIYTIELTGGHKYYLQGCPNGGSDTTYKLRINYGGSARANDYGTGAFWSPSNTVTVYIYVSVYEGATATNKIFKPNLIDLTATFGTTVANRLYALEQAQAGTGIAKAKEILVKDYYPYNVTDFTHVKTNGKQNVGFNLFNLPAMLTSTGDPITAVTNPHLSNKTLFDNKELKYQGRVEVSVKGFVRNSGSTGSVLYRIYYTDGTASSFVDMQHDTTTVSENGKIVDYIRTTYSDAGSMNCTNAKINVSLYWDGERDGEYEDYQEWNYPVEDIELKGILSLDAQDNWVADGDEYLPGGIVNRKWVERTITSSDVYLAETDTNVVYAGFRTADGELVSTSKKIVCPKYVYAYLWPFDTASGIGTISGNAGSNAWWVGFAPGTTEEQMKTALNGMTILVQRSSVVQSSADPYTELQNDSNWGTEKWIDTRDVPMPVFSTCEYIPDLKAKLETAPESPDEDGDYIMHRENGLNSYGSLSTYLANEGYNKTSDLLGMCGVLQNASYMLRRWLAEDKSLQLENVLVVNMGDLTWTYSSAEVFYAQLPNGKAGNAVGIDTILSPKYNTVTGKNMASMSNGDMEYARGVYVDTGEIVIKDTSYTNAADFKKAVNGLLVAYEKA